ncbi:MAG: ammonia-forming cytochrome c nitrite reductase subunit c552 [Ruaniaceae bacterium]|nr:ammonia-forming cytochrome c nitrite reductase subunit c552 [Ruaniaceae bacterium]
METSTTPTSKRGQSPKVLALIFVGAIVVTVTITALLINIFERKQEGHASFAPVVQIDETVVDPAVWGQNFPSQYEAFLRTAEFTESAHGGVMVPHDVEGDPRTEVPSSKLEEDPRLVDMWLGYPFAVDYRHARGHEYMILDQQFTLRNTEFNQPGTCLNCHASTPSMYTALGDGDRQAGFLAMGTISLDDAIELAEHPVSCIDCHDPETMALRITRPAFAAGIAELKALEGVEDYEVNRDATRQEMRSYVCAQCHVEYYFAGEDKVLEFPWEKGLDIDDIWDHYQDVGHVDWVHERTGAEMLKAQHPEFDIWAQGVHAKNGVSCVDCHMAYEREGAVKVTNHHITTPLADINASCGTCHTTGDGVLADRVTTIQDRFIESRDRSLDALVFLIGDIETAIAEGTPEEYIDLAREYQNKASFYIDYVYSENSYGFHAPDYIQRILSQALDAARLGQLALTGVPAEDLQPSVTTVNNLNASLRSQ